MRLHLIERLEPNKNFNNPDLKYDGVASQVIYITISFKRRKQLRNSKLSIVIIKRYVFNL